MISERKFSSAFTSTWRELLPTGDDFLRSVNLRAERYLTPFDSDLRPELYGIVNEAAFRFLVLAVKSKRKPADIPGEALRAELAKVVSWLSKYRSKQDEPRAFTESEILALIDEGLTLAARIASFYSYQLQMDLQSLVFDPKFIGCGIVDECYGDIFYDKTIYEIKAGERNFRSVDLRQVLVYCALDYASGTKQLSEICLLNPRHGVYWLGELEEVAEECGAGSAVELLEQLRMAMYSLSVSQ